MVSCSFYAGSYTRAYGPFEANGQGIYHCELSLATGALRCLGVTGGIENPAYVTIDPAGRHLYAVQETEGDPDAEVFAFRIAADGRLEILNRQPVQGGLPCHLGLDGTGKWLAVASYGGGSVELFPVSEDGRLDPAAALRQHRGASVEPLRQTRPHPHAAVFSPETDLFFVPDLGLDRVFGYRIQRGRKILLGQVSSLSAPPGSGPRQLVFHPGGNYAFLVHELSSSLALLRYREGALTPLANPTTLPGTFQGPNTCAAVGVHPSGGAVFVTNRGHDSIAVFGFDESSERLELRQILPSGGYKPRDLTLTPDGRWLLVANHHGNSVCSFAVAADTCTLEPSGHNLEVASPACLKVRPQAGS